MNLYTWALRWNVPVEAINDLRQQMGVDPVVSAVPGDATSESGVSKRKRLAFAEEGGLLWRNNLGAFKDEYGNFIRYGLANESAGMNKKVKSSDLIGVRPVTITQEMVGFIIGQFVACETKHPGWRYRGDDHEVAQLKFLELVTSKGGHASFETGE